MAFFKSNTKQTVLTDDPVFNALISYTNTGNGYISPAVLRNSDIFSAINIIASDVASNEVYCDVPVLTKLFILHHAIIWTAFISSIRYAQICF